MSSTLGSLQPGVPFNLGFPLTLASKISSSPAAQSYQRLLSQPQILQCLLSSVVQNLGLPATGKRVAENESILFCFLLV